MTERFALYFAPARDSALNRLADAWLGQADLQPLTVSARRYGFHATLKAPMALAAGCDRAGLERAMATFARQHRPVTIGRLEANLLEGFVALTPADPPQALTDFAATVVTAFEAFRAPLGAAERQRRLAAQLTPRQIELVEAYGYPYVLEQFLLHMTLTDRLTPEQEEPMRRRAAAWFAAALAEPVVLDRLVLFYEAEPGTPFRRLDDYLLEGSI